MAVPIGYESRYPYSADGKMPGPENAPIPDPLVWLGYAAAVSKTINLATGILILPQRSPIYTAKEFATLDVLSKGRAIAGIGIGWLQEEFEALDIPFKERAPRTDRFGCARSGYRIPRIHEHQVVRPRRVECRPATQLGGGIALDRRFE